MMTNTSVFPVDVASQKCPRSSSRINQSTREFEAQLLSAILGPLEKGLSKIAGDEGSSESDGFNDMGAEALATALSNGGGIGIAKMLETNLERTKVR
jgi:Rod binding domain-containing protein